VIYNRLRDDREPAGRWLRSLEQSYVTHPHRVRAADVQLRVLNSLPATLPIGCSNTSLANARANYRRPSRKPNDDRFRGTIEHASGGFASPPL
jgi:hypothetical protein